MDLGKQVDALRETFSGFDGVRFAVLYGSAAESEQYRDLDVAVLLDRKLAPAALDLAYGTELELALFRAVDFPVDLRIVNDARLPFRYAVSRGRPLLLNDPESWYLFRERTWDEWFDFEPIARRHLEYIAWQPE